jgi:hypothetical protein
MNCVPVLEYGQRIQVVNALESSKVFTMERAALLIINKRSFIVDAKNSRAASVNA